MQRLRSKTPIMIAALVLLLAVLVGTVLAGSQTMTMTWTYGTSTPTGDINGTSASGQGGYANAGIPNATTATGTGLYRLMANFWNNNSTWVSRTVAAQTLTFNDQTGAYYLSNYTASTYFPSGRTGLACPNPDTDVNNACHWTPVNPHYPSDYPSLYKGCHYSNCSVGTGGPFPMTLNSLVSLTSTWKVTLPNAGVGTFDVAYDIWLDKNDSGNLPNSPGSINQNDGAEIMLWVNNHGYATSGTASKTTPITPAGHKLNTTYTDSTGAVWDIWVGRQSGPPDWNIVSYVRQTGTTNFTDDTKEFLDNALTINDSICPADTANGIGAGDCVLPGWWLTSVQTGFEIWDLPSDGGASQGGALGTTALSIAPLTVLGNDAIDVTGRARNGNLPVIHWEDIFTLKKASCPNATSANVTITPGNGIPSTTYTLTETPSGSGIYVNTAVGALYPGHDGSTISYNIVCPSGPADTGTVPVFIDPSGHVVVAQSLLPIKDATVTLLYSATSGGTFAPAPSSMISPTVNTETTDILGAFRWDVLAGYYKVQAAHAGCTTYTTGVLPVPPPQVDLLLKLTCATVPPDPYNGGTPPSGVTVQLTTMTDWGTGYCDNVIVTNNTTAAVTWNVNFPFPGGTIYNHWNFNYTGPTGGQFLNAHGVGWNDVLQPGASTNSIGFCANR